MRITELLTSRSLKIQLGCRSELSQTFNFECVFPSLFLLGWLPWQLGLYYDTEDLIDD